MAKKKNNLTTNTPDELRTLVEEKRNELRALRFSVAGSKNKDVKLAQKLRRDIARALTQLNQSVQ